MDSIFELVCCAQLSKCRYWCPELREFLKLFGISCGELTGRKEVTKMLTAVNKHPISQVLRIKFLRSLKQACYRSTPDGGKSRSWAHYFTSSLSGKSSDTERSFRGNERVNVKWRRRVFRKVQKGMLCFTSVIWYVVMGFISLTAMRHSFTPENEEAYKWM